MRTRTTRASEMGLEGEKETRKDGKKGKEKRR